MLRHIGNSISSADPFMNSPKCEMPNPYNRNEKDDMKIAIDALYEFRKKLSELHPTCIELIENMLQHRRY